MQEGHEKEGIFVTDVPDRDREYSQKMQEALRETELWMVAGKDRAWLTNHARTARDLRGAPDHKVGDILQKTSSKMRYEEKAGIELVGHIGMVREEEQTIEECEARRREEESRHE